MFPFGTCCDDFDNNTPTHWPERNEARIRYLSHIKYKSSPWRNYCGQSRVEAPDSGGRCRFANAKTKCDFLYMKILFAIKLSSCACAVHKYPITTLQTSGRLHFVSLERTTCFRFHTSVWSLIIYIWKSDMQRAKIKLVSFGVPFRIMIDDVR